MSRDLTPLQLQTYRRANSAVTQPMSWSNNAFHSLLYYLNQHNELVQIIMLRKSQTFRKKVNLISCNYKSGCSKKAIRYTILFSPLTLDFRLIVLLHCIFSYLFLSRNELNFFWPFSNLPTYPLHSGVTLPSGAPAIFLAPHKNLMSKKRVTTFWRPLIANSAPPELFVPTHPPG